MASNLADKIQQQTINKVFDQRENFIIVNDVNSFRLTLGKRA